MFVALLRRTWRTWGQVSTSLESLWSGAMSVPNVLRGSRRTGLRTTTCTWCIVVED